MRQNHGINKVLMVGKEGNLTLQKMNSGQENKLKSRNKRYLRKEMKMQRVDNGIQTTIFLERFRGISMGKISNQQYSLGEK